MCKFKYSSFRRRLFRWCILSQISALQTRNRLSCKRDGVCVYLRQLTWICTLIYVQQMTASISQTFSHSSPCRNFHPLFAHKLNADDNTRNENLRNVSIILSDTRLSAVGKFADGVPELRTSQINHRVLGCWYTHRALAILWCSARVTQKETF